MSKKIEVVSVSGKGTDYISYEKIDVAKYQLGDGEYLITHSFLLDSFRKLMGKTLTVIDASITDKQQNKAMKDMIRGIFSDEMEFAAELCFDQEKMQEKIPDDIDPETLGSVSIEEVLGVEN